MTASIPPAGWLPDPDRRGILRWWDGAKWTESAGGPGCRPTPAVGDALPRRPLPPAAVRRPVVLLLLLPLLFSVLVVGTAAAAPSSFTVSSVSSDQDVARVQIIAA